MTLAEKYAGYKPNLDQLAERLAGADEMHARFTEACRLIAVSGYALTYTGEMGGRAAAWADMERWRAAGRDASVARANDHDSDAWTITVPGWSS